MGWKNYNLITFGCSHTYGVGLPDCVVANMVPPNITPPSKSAWPVILKQLVGFKSLDNKSFPAISNRIIAKNAVEYKHYTKDSVVIIFWTNFDRHTIFEDAETNKYHFLAGHIDGKPLPSLSLQSVRDVERYRKQLLNYYSELLTDYDSIFSQIVLMNYVNTYLNSNGIKCFHIVAEHNYGKEYSDWSKYNIPNLKLKLFTWDKDFKIDDGLDVPHPHPGVNSHKLLATNVRQWFFR